MEHRRHRKVTGNAPSGPADFIPVVEMEVGDMFTVHSCREDSQYKDNSFHGDILTVTAVSAPYIFVLWAGEHCGFEEREVKIDTRRYNFVGISNEYIDRMLKVKQQNRDRRRY